MQPAISHASAARFWRAYGTPGMPSVRRVSDDSPPAPSILDAATARRARTLPVIRQENVVHFTASSQKLRRASRGVLCHSVSNALPAEAVLEIAGAHEISIVSPELSFVQMSSALSFLDLIRYGSMLCSLFSIDQSDTRRASMLHRRMTPVASVKSIGRFVESAPHMKGRAIARRALRYIVENARSPLEIDAALHLCLPRKQGGSNLPEPCLNQKIWLAQPVEAIDARGQIRYIDAYECDLVWTQNEKTVVVEYQGEAYHGLESDMHRDSIKANVLSSQGIRVFTLTKAQLYDLRQFQRFVDALQNALGIHARCTVSDFEQRQARLHAELIRPLNL